MLIQVKPGTYHPAGFELPPPPPFRRWLQNGEARRIGDLIHKPDGSPPEPWDSQRYMLTQCNGRNLNLCPRAITAAEADCNPKPQEQETRTMHPKTGPAIFSCQPNKPADPEAVLAQLRHTAAVGSLWCHKPSYGDSTEVFMLVSVAHCGLETGGFAAVSLKNGFAFQSLESVDGRLVAKRDNKKEALGILVPFVGTVKLESKET